MIGIYTTRRECLMQEEPMKQEPAVFKAVEFVMTKIVMPLWLIMPVSEELIAIWKDLGPIIFHPMILSIALWLGILWGLLHLFH
jgi:hypothetical protein